MESLDLARALLEEFERGRTRGAGAAVNIALLLAAQAYAAIAAAEQQKRIADILETMRPPAAS